MAKFTTNSRRFDPYKNFKFRLKWDGKYVAGISKVGDIKKSKEKSKKSKKDKEAASKGQSKFTAITLERGVTHDAEFEKWASAVWKFGSALKANSALKDLRKDIVLEVYNEAGKRAKTFKILRTWVSEFQALPDLDANANAVAIQHLKLENEGWERIEEENKSSKVVSKKPKK